MSSLIQKGFGHVPEPGALEVLEDTNIGREAYIAMYGPTVGDRIRLGDTELWIEVERDMVRGTGPLWTLSIHAYTSWEDNLRR